MSAHVEELHWSDLKKMARAPAAFRWSIDHPSPQTPAMALGTLVHALVLGGKYVLFEGERRGAKWAEFKAAHEGDLIVTSSEKERANMMAEAVMGNRLVQELRLLEGKHECSWSVRMHGRRCVSRGFDVIEPSRHIVDLKTASTTEPFAFRRACLRMAYHAQLAWYRGAADVLYGRAKRECWIVGVESAAPHIVTVLRIPEKTLDAGAKLNRLWLESLAACEEANEWPGYVQSPVDLDIDEDGEQLMIDGEYVDAA